MSHVVDPECSRRKSQETSPLEWKLSWVCSWRRWIFSWELFWINSIGWKCRRERRPQRMWIWEVNRWWRSNIPCWWDEGNTVVKKLDLQGSAECLKQDFDLYRPWEHQNWRPREDNPLERLENSLDHNDNQIGGKGAQSIAKSLKISHLKHLFFFNPTSLVKAENVP